MAKKSIKEREKKRANLNSKYKDKIAELKGIIKNGSPEEAWHARLSLQEIPKNAHLNRQRKRCMITGRSRGIVGDFMLSRIKFREWAEKGYIPGLVISSW